MSQSDIEQAEITLEDAKQIAKLGRLAEQLAANSAFKKLVLEGYFEKEAARLALCFSDPMLNPRAQEEVKNALHGVGAFRRYLHRIVTEGQIAAGSILDYEAEIEEMRREADEGSDA